MASYTRKTPEEQLANIEEKMKKLKAREQKIKSQVSKQERKTRTRRLIQTGAIFESYFETESLEDSEKLMRELKALLIKRDDEAL